MNTMNQVTDHLPSHTTTEEEALRDDIKTNGLKVPVVIDDSDNVIDGRLRVRLRASSVRGSDVQELGTTIAHELAHTEQKAEGLHFESDDECERDVEERLKSWNFVDGTTKDDERTLRDTLDSIIRLARKGKAAIHDGQVPSRNFAADEIRQADRAVEAVIKASKRWRGE